MSTLTVSNISDATTTVGTSYVVNGSSKAWVNFDGTGTIAARDSFNVSSLTDQGTGAYDVSFTNSMANDDYLTLGYSNCDTVFADFTPSAFTTLGSSYSPMSGATTSGTSLGAYISGTGYTDAAINFVSTVGDLA
jgi:hypothetical protein